MSDRIHIATRKGLFFLDRAPSGWEVGQAHFLGDNVSMLLSDPRDGALYAALDHGHFGVKLHRLEAGSTQWTEIGTPSYPEQPPDLPERRDDHSESGTSPQYPWSLRLIWSLESGGPDRNGVLWAGTCPGGLFRSEDRGQSWELNRPLWDRAERAEWMGGGFDVPGIHSICVDPRDSNRIHVGVSIGGVWGSTDGGQSWSCRSEGMRAEYLPEERAYDANMQDGHRLVQCRAEPDKFWCQHHNGVFRSTDGSQAWTEIESIEPSRFGFAVAVHPHDGDTAWFLPAIKDEKRIPVDGRLVVARTRDGGRSFEPLRDGLPQQHAYDLILRHGLDVDAHGERLAFGSSTGSVWVSEDGGDSWQLISAHLPPIYCLRFA